MNSFGVTTGTEKREPAALHPIQHKIQGSLQENGTETTGDPTAGTPASSSVPGTPGLIQRQHRWVRGRRLGEETEPWQLSSLHVLCLTVVSTVGHKLHKGVAKFSTKLKQSKHRLSSFFVRYVIFCHAGNWNWKALDYPVCSHFQPQIHYSCQLVYL